MTSLKEISHLFITHTKSLEELGSPGQNGNVPLYTILIPGFVDQFTSLNFTRNLAKGLSRKISTVFLCHSRHASTNCSFMSQYVVQDKARDEIRVTETIDNVLSEEKFDKAYHKLTHTNLLLIDYPDIAGHESASDLLSVCNDIILLMTPDSDIDKICSLAESFSNAIKSLVFKIGITETYSYVQAQSIYEDLVIKLRGKLSAKLEFLGNIAPAASPHHVVMGGRVINLANPATITSMEESFQRILKNVVDSINQQKEFQKSRDVFNALQKRLQYGNFEQDDGESQSTRERNNYSWRNQFLSGVK